MARPSKFTPETVTAILTGIRAGLPYRLAAEAAGISETTFHQWQSGTFPRGADLDLKRQFSEQLTRAKGESARRLTILIATAATEDWRAAAWLLERRFPADYGKDADLHARLDAIEAALAGDGQPQPIRRVI